MQNFSERAGPIDVPSILLNLPREILRRGKLLIVPTVLAGLLAYGAATQLPVWYTSVATLSMKEADAQIAESLMRSNAVIDAVVKLHPEIEGVSPEAKRRFLNRSFRFAVPSAAAGLTRKTTTLFNLEVDSKSPAVAQTMSNHLIDNWLLLTKPRAVAKTRFEEHLARLESQLRDVQALINRLEKETTTLVAPSSIQGELATPLAGLLQRRDAFVEKITDIKASLAGGTRDVVVSAPSLPTEPTWPRKAMIAAVCSSIVGALLLIYVIASFFISVVRNGVGGRAAA